MVDNYNALIDVLNKNNKVLLFALLRMDDLTDRWSILISGEDLKDLKKRKKLFDDIVELMREKVPPEELNNVARIGVFPLSNHLVKDVLGYSGKIENKKANGSFIHLGYVLINRKKNTNMRLV